MDNMSPLQIARLQYQPKLPKLLSKLSKLNFVKEKNPSVETKAEDIKQLFPLSFGQPLVTFDQSQNVASTVPKTVGVVFSGGQAAGGHNVITGLFDALKALNNDSRLIGFIGGPSGIIQRKYRELDERSLLLYRNQGGFDLIGSGRTKIETDEQLKASLETVIALGLDGLVIIGGDDSNTNAAILAEYFLTHKTKTVVIGVPKTIDGDLKNDYVEVSFGFDTACRVYSEAIGNILSDCLSAKKYYHFIKLMGRSASHIALECALQTHPNYTLIGEEVAEKKQTLSQVTREIADFICKRAEKGKNYGVILVPEGLIEFIPEIKQLISELNALLGGGQDHTKSMKAQSTIDMKVEYLKPLLTPAALTCLQSLPESIQAQLLLERDPHGNVQVSLINTEQLLIATVASELKKRGAAGSYNGTFIAQPHFFGYEGRCSLPSQFDTHYCYSLGHVAALLIRFGVTGYMACVKHLTQSVESWEICGVPLTMMMRMDKRKGQLKPVVTRALVDLNGKVFRKFVDQRERWAVEDEYRSPGPIQFFGDPQITDAVPLSLISG